MYKSQNKFIKICFAILFHFALTAISTYAQGICDVYDFRIDTIKGRVISNSPNGDEPIPKAKIELRRISDDLEIIVIKTVFSNENGFFEIDAVPKGEYQLAVSQEELRFIHFFIGINVVKKKNRSKREKSLIIKLGVSVIKPCGGGKAWVVEDS